MCIIQIYRGQWEAAREALGGAFPAEEIRESWKREQIENLDLLFEEAKNARRKSPGAASWLSTALPGAGQLYAGDPWDALNAFAVNAGVVALIFAAFRQEWYLEGALLFVYPFRRYYLGNREKARLDAEEHNRTLDDRYRRKLIDGILVLLESPGSSE
jgi:hypothetical protein